MAQKMEHATQANMKSLIEECHEVAQAASSCATHCIETYGNAMSEFIRNRLDAATVAEATASLAARGSPFVKDIAKVAGDVFHKCAVVCDSRRGDHDTLSRCADASETASETSREVGARR